VNVEFAVPESSPSPTAVSFTVDAGSAWREELRAADISPAQVGRSLSHDLTGFLTGLGIPAAAHVEMRADDGEDATLRGPYDLRLLSEGYPLRYPAQLAERARDRESGDNPLDALRALVLDIAQLHPQHLLKDDAAAALLGRSRDWPVGTDWGAPILRKLLGQAVSLRHADTVVRRLAEAARFGLAPDEAMEIAMVRVRPRSVEVQIDHGYANALFDVDLKNSESVPLSSIPAAAPHLDGLIQALFTTLGVRVPNVHLVGRSGLPENGFAVRVNERESGTWQGPAPDEVFVTATSASLSSAGVPHRPQLHPGSGLTCGIVSSQLVSAFEDAGIRVIDGAGFLTLVLMAELRRRAGQMLDLAQVEYELGLIAQTHPDLVDAALARTSPARLTAILRTLLGSGVPIRDLRGILERVVGFRWTVADAEDRLVVGDGLIVDRRYAPRPFDGPTPYARYVRMGVAAAICHLATDGSRSLSVLVLDDQLERLILASVERSVADGRDAVLSPGDVDVVHESVGQAIASLVNDTVRPALTARPEVAEALRETLPSEFPGLIVLSHDDIVPDVLVNVVAQVAPAYRVAGPATTVADSMVGRRVPDAATEVLIEPRPSMAARPPAVDSSALGAERRP
jgi:hypothetical protein